MADTSIVEKSKKDTFRERFSKRYPEVNLEDEESYYDGVNRMFDEYEGYEGNSKKMRERMSKSPAFAEMIIDSQKQDDFDPVVWMVENKGLDLKALGEDPEYSKRLASAHELYLKKLAKADEIEKQMQENMPASVDAIRAKAQEMGLTDEQAEETIGRMYQVMDDLIVGKIDPSLFEMMAKGMNYDTAVAEAKDEGVAQGLSAKVEDKLRNLNSSQPKPRGQQSAVTERKEVEVVNPFV